MIDPQNDQIDNLPLADLAQPAGTSPSLERHLQWNSYLSTRHKLLYVSTPKVACTTLKWWFASLEGYAQALHTITDSNESDPDLVVHESHKVAPHVTGLPIEALTEALQAPDYFRFAVVRNPFKRLFSAWQSKLLLREPLQTTAYVDTAFFHLPVNTPADIPKAFEGFLEHLAANETPSFWDHHWAPQFDVLRPDLIDYSVVGKIEQASDLSASILRWVGPYAPDPFAVRRANESLIPYQPDWLTERSAQLVTSVYAIDFDTFGYERAPPASRETFTEAQMQVALQAVGLIRARHHQLGERSARIDALSAALSARDAEVDQLRQTEAELAEPAGGLQETVMARDVEFAEMQRLRGSAEGKIASLTLALEQHQADLATLRETLVERDASVASLSDARTTLERAAAASEARAASLTQAMTTRDAALAVATDNLGTSDRQVSALQRDMRERDAELVRVSGLIERQESELAQLREQVAAIGLARECRDKEVADFTNAVVERDAAIVHLTNEAAKRLIDKDNEIWSLQRELHQLQQTIAGRLTLPVRLPGLGVPWKQQAATGTVSSSVLQRGLERVFRSAARKIRASSLFDAEFYRNAYPDLRDSNLDLATHYFIHGWRERRNPSALFNTAQYLVDNPDVEASGTNPLLHYLKHGRREGRQLAPAPTPVVAALTNGAGYPVEEVGGSAALATTIGSFSQPHPFRKLAQDELTAQVEDIRASKLFDEKYYVSMYPELSLDSEEAIRHFCEHGWMVGKNPSDEFDTNFYLAIYNDIAEAGVNPFWHYAIAGKAEIRHALADPAGRYETDIRFGPITSDIQAIAFYTSPDWQALRGGQPAFKGHAYPLQPGRDLGYYDLADWQVLKRQAETAKQHGITGFSFDLDMTRYGSGALPLEQFLGHDDIQIGFCTQLRLPDIPAAKLGEVLASVMDDDRHILIDGRPVLIAEVNATGSALSHILSELRQILADSGVPNPFIIGRLAGDGLSTAEMFDAVLDFPGVTTFGAHAIINRDGTDTVPYSVVASQGVARTKMALAEERPFYHGITVGHDDTAQSPNRPLVYTRFNIGDYRRWLDAVIDVTRSSHPADRRLLFLSAWNNWNTGELLEPDLAAGYARLNETARALANLPVALRMPKVSVLVPNYNHEPFLRRRLDSIYRQSYKNIEVILMDDNSSDQSRSVLSEYAAANPDITRTIFNETNSGSPFRQWAKGIKQANGDLIWIAESDDYCEEDFLNSLVRCFEDEGVLLAYGSSIFVDLQEVPLPHQYNAYVSELEYSAKWNGAYVETAHNEVRQALGLKNTIPNASGAVFRRPLSMPLLDDECWQSMRVAGDWVFYLHILRGGKIAYQPDAVNFFRRYTGSTADATYKKEIFYREVGIASQTVAALYDVPWNTLERCRTGYEEFYWNMVGNSSEEFASWYNYNAVAKARETRMPNIVVSTMGFFPGGAEILPIRMANEFRRQGHSVLLLSANLLPREDGVRRMVRNDVPLIETANVADVAALLRNFGIEALNSHQWHVQKFPLVVPDVFDSLRVHVASLHGMLEHGEAFKVTEAELKIADSKVTTWVYTADKNLGPFVDQDLYRDGSPKFVKLPNGMQAPAMLPIKRAQIGIPEDAFVLCCVSRAIPDKGWAETIEAVTMARELSGRDIHLILVGNGLVYDEYCRTGVPDFVHLVGFSENSVGYYAAADMGIMLTTFKSESFPLTIVDCLFAGKPYIATSVGEIRNMLSDGEEVAGAVLDLDDWAVPIAAAAEIIARFASDRDAYLAAQARVSPLAQRYRIDVVAAQYVELFAARRHAGRIGDKVGTN